MLAIDVTDEESPTAVRSRTCRPAPSPDPITATAQEIGATGHAVFAFVRAARGRELLCLLRRDFPEVSPPAGGLFAASAMNAVKPFWWARGGGGASGLDELRWARRLEGPLPGPAGLAFPVFDGQRGAGLVVFVGTLFLLSDRTLPDIHRRCLALFAEVSGPQAAASRETASLAKRELECIRLAADGLTSGDIARRLGLSLHTANQYLAEAAHKLNANGRMHAVAKALRLGLID
jgi:DNA-binding CsgD family transcriptional regulator